MARRIKVGPLLGIALAVTVIGATLVVARAQVPPVPAPSTGSAPSDPAPGIPGLTPGDPTFVTPPDGELVPAGPIGVPSAAAGGLGAGLAPGAPAASDSTSVAGVTTQAGDTADSSTSREAETVDVAGVQAAAPPASSAGGSPLANVVATVLPSTGGPGIVLAFGLLGLAGAGVGLRRLGCRR